MKTWQMIKELTENPEKIFISDKGQKGNEMTAERLQQNIIFKYTNKYVEVDRIDITREWEEAKTPVTFMEAVKSGKRIRVEHKLVNNSDNGDLITLTPLDCLIYALGEDYHSTAVKEIIENGKWYIED